jgi:hypothetical protein
MAFLDKGEAEVLALLKRLIAFFVKMKIVPRLSRPSESIPLKKDQG